MHTFTSWQSTIRGGHVVEWEYAQDYDERNRPVGPMYYTGRYRYEGGEIYGG